jgi:hypothetical protein
MQGSNSVRPTVGLGARAAAGGRRAEPDSASEDPGRQAPYCRVTETRTAPFGLPCRNVAVTGTSGITPSVDATVASFCRKWPRFAARLAGLGSFRRIRGLRASGTRAPKFRRRENWVRRNRCRAHSPATLLWAPLKESTRAQWGVARHCSLAPCVLDFLICRLCRACTTDEIPGLFGELWIRRIRRIVEFCRANGEVQRRPRALQPWHAEWLFTV